MVNRISYITVLLLLINLFCKAQKTVDDIFHHGVIYTVDSSFKIAEAFAVDKGKIVAVGSNDEILKNYTSSSITDLKGKPVYPGFIDAHCHFYNYGLGLNNADLVGTKSFQEVIDIIVKHAKEHPTEWVLGRGWDQNTWAIKEFPDKEILDSLFPNTPVFLTRIDGHAAIVNQEALNRANVNILTNVSGGVIVKKKLDNGLSILTGVLVDNAVDLVKKVIPPPNKKEQEQALKKAEENCFAVGLTTIDDAGLDKQVIDLIDEMQKNNSLKMRVYAMLKASKENMDYYFKQGKYKTDRLDVRSVKLFADGALGSRGACLLTPYKDKPEQQGFLLQTPEYYKDIIKQCYQHGFQVNTHCIGDSAVRFILHSYAEQLKGKNDLRWRVEHAQVVNKDDFNLFGKYSIIPSVQPTHATSDMYWAEDRLGKERLKGAYAYQQLLQQNHFIANGSDFPVESINPLFGFYAGVVRKDQKNYPKDGFQIENKISRKEALKGMTIWAAFSNFEENEKGSIEPGKFADFVILNQDIMKIDEKELYKVKVYQTYVAGFLVYSQSNPNNNK